MTRDSHGRSAIWAGSILILASFASLGRAQDPPVNALLMGSWSEYGGAYSDIWADGDYAFVGNAAIFDGNDAQILVLNVSDPKTPFLATTFFIPPPNHVASPQDVKSGDGLLFVSLDSGGQDGVAIVDIRDPTAPVQLATVRLPGYEDVHNTYYDDVNDVLYLADSRTPRVGILDLAGFDPDNPPPSPITEPTWILTDVGNAFVHDITVQDNRLYCAAWTSGLWVFDVTDVANTEPVFLGSVDGNSTHSMWPTGNGQYVVVGEERSNGGLKVFEVTDEGGALSFTQTDSLVLVGDAYSVHNPVVIDNRVYVSWYQAGLQVFDLNPADGTLEFRSSYDTSLFMNNGTYAGAWGVYPFLGTDRVLVSDIEAGIFVVATLPDECPEDEDCNVNGESDFCDLLTGESLDCNMSFVPDECEIADGSSEDCQLNGIPDECEADCNENSVPDDCDISAGTSLDCQLNGIPDECEGDCNGNSVPDDCDLDSGFSEDCQPNGIPDECDLAAGPMEDVQLSQAPNQDDGFVADADDGALYDAATAAEDFVIEFNKRIETIKVWGGYLFFNSPPSEDHFTVILHEDSGAFPGTAIYTEEEVETLRVKTGKALFGFWDEYEITLSLAEPVDLAPGTYYVEVFNNTDGDNDTFIWETSSTGQIPGFFFTEEVPGSHWSAATGLNLAIEVTGGVIGADCNGNTKPDECDVSDGTSNDNNGDTIPDECEDCDGDVNGDEVIDPLDTGFVLSRFGCPVGSGDSDCDAADANGDLVVDPLDVGYILSRFGECP